MTGLLADLSNNNGAGAVQVIADPRIAAVYAKGTESTNFQDPLWPVFRAAAARLRKPIGPYAFLHPAVDGAAQARYLIAYTKPVAGDLQPVIDSETWAGSVLETAKTTLDALVELRTLGFDPIGYGSQSFWAQLVAAQPKLKGFRYWQAQYASRMRAVPGLRTVLWQFTDRQVVGKGCFHVDGDRLLVRNLQALRIPAGHTVTHPAPKPARKRPVKRPPAPKPAAKQPPVQGEPKDEKPFTRPPAAKKPSSKKKPS